MSKIDIVVSRDMTINCGNYSSIKPSVSLTLKDVDSENALDKYKQLSRVLDVLMMCETQALGDEMESIQDWGYKRYLTELEKVDREMELLEAERIMKEM